MPKRLNLFHNFDDDFMARLSKIGRMYPDEMSRTGRGAGNGMSAAIRQGMRALVAMSPAELDQHLGNGQFLPEVGVTTPSKT